MSGPGPGAMQELKRRIEDHLFGTEGATAYAVLDAARWRGVRGFLDDHGARYACLHAGDLDAEVLAVSPYLVELPEDSDLFDHVFAEGWGDSRGIFLTAYGALLDVRRHFRGLAYAEMPDGEVTLFRFYDPRAFRVFMGVASPDQLSAMSGALVTGFLMEDETGAGGLRYLPGQAEPSSL